MMSVFACRLHLSNPMKTFVRNIESNAALIEKIGKVHNKNPRNLELLRIARKPTGYFLDKTDPRYWHK